MTVTVVATRRRRPDRVEQYEDPAYQRLLATLSTNLKQLRATRGWTQEEAADRCGMTTRFLQALEGQEKNFTATTLARLANGLGVEAAALITPAPAVRAVAGASSNRKQRSEKKKRRRG